MGHRRGGIAHLSGVIEEDLRDRQTGLHLPHIKGLADLAASALAVRSVNSSEWITVLPRQGCDRKSRERYISRFLSNKRICPLSVMEGFVPEILKQSGSGGKTVVFILDQSKVAEGFECLMVSLRVGQRAIPIAWEVVQTQGGIGFDVQEPLLDRVATMVPKGLSILLAADRFYGTPALIRWCRTHRWAYRIRLRGNLLLTHDGGEIATGDAARGGMTALVEARFQKTDVTTNIGILHERGHPEPWIIAMDCIPSKYKTLDYGMRWGIESLFSDLKSRGFGITKTKLTNADRIGRLLLILTIATYWAVSTGMMPAEEDGRHTKKNASAP